MIFLVKIKNPLFSLRGRGKLGDIIFLRRRNTDIAEKTPQPKDIKSPAQLSWRLMYQQAVSLWNALSAGEKQEWESLARPKHMTGFACFISQALKPNPGLYLPLQGGVMQGNIDMGDFHLLKLPLPTSEQEPVTLKYLNDNLPSSGYTEGTRVYSSTNISIPTNTLTALPFDSERYDTDAVHDTVTNNSRLTCKTPGIYIIIAQVHFSKGARGIRNIRIMLNAATELVFAGSGIYLSGDWESSITTIYHLDFNDFIEVFSFFTGGNSLDIVALANRSPEFMMQRIG